MTDRLIELLCQRLGEKLQAAPTSDLNDLIRYLQEVIEADDSLKQALTDKAVQINQGDTTGYQVLVEGGQAYIGTHLQVADPNLLEAALDRILAAYLSRSSQVAPTDHSQIGDRRVVLKGHLRLLYEQLEGKEKALILASAEEKVRIHQQIRDLRAEIDEFEVELKQLEAGADLPNNLNRRGILNSEWFVGREKALTDLHEKLKDNKPLAIAGVVGMGGVGKTELAIQYARQHWQDYKGGVIWLAGERAVNDLLGFAQSQLFPKFKLADLGDVPVQLGYCWRNWPAQGDPPQPVLLIFDDVTDYRTQVQPCLPEDSRFRVLLTTRERFQGINRLELDVLDSQDALTLLEHLVGVDRVHGEAKTAAELCEWLGYLPLGLELVGNYLQEEECSFAELFKALKDRKRKVLHHPSLIQPEPTMTAQYGVAAAFELSWERLDLDARFLGAYLSVFASAPIRWELVVAPGEASSATEEALQTARRKLVRLSLLKRVGTMVQFHPLIREFFIEKRESDEFVIPPSHQLTGQTGEILRLFGAVD